MVLHNGQSAAVLRWHVWLHAKGGFMAGNTANLLYGQIDDVLDILDCEQLEEHELRAALQNAFKHIKSLQNQINQLKGA